MSLLALCSCESMFENKIVNEWSDEEVWRIPELAEGVLLQAYSEIPRRVDNFDGDFLDAATDNAVTNKWSSDVYIVGNGGLSANDNRIGNWSVCLSQIQTINEFLEKGLTDNLLYDRTNEENDLQIKKRLEGEAYFLRAWWGFALLQRHGGRTSDGSVLGYPISTSFVTPEQALDKTDYHRDTYEACVDRIVEDCDMAASLLPEKYTGNSSVVGVTKLGRGDATAAKALKSRVLLYAASPAFQSKEVVDIRDMGQFEVLDQAEYERKWEIAAKCADELIQSSGFGAFYGLKATDIASAGNKTPSEFIFRTYHNDNEMEKRHFPPFYYGSARNVPSQNLVDAFPTKDGFPISDSRSSYDESRPFDSQRDNRFQLNIYYQGRKFGDGDKIDVVSGGKDAEDFNEFGTRTGYYLAKFMANKSAMLTPLANNNQIHYYPLLRKAEVFLNYAEAANEAWGPKEKGDGCKYTAYEVIKMIREKSGGITDVTYLDEMAASKDLFRQLIQNERRLELAFENHWFFDIRRWLLPLNQEVQGCVVTRENGVETFSRKTVERRVMDDIKYYYIPIPHSEVLKSGKMVNNIGW